MSNKQYFSLFDRIEQWEQLQNQLEKRIKDAYLNLLLAQRDEIQTNFSSTFIDPAVHIPSELHAKYIVKKNENSEFELIDTKEPDFVSCSSSSMKHAQESFQNLVPLLIDLANCKQRIKQLLQSHAE